MARLLFALALLLACADAFVVSPVRAPVRAPMLRSAVPCMGVEEAAADCLESGCSLDDVSVLIEELTAESDAQASGSLAKARTLGLITQLKELNKEPVANKNELEKIIAGMARTFGTVEAFNFPGEPLGYSSQPGTTTTAGKSLD